MNADRLVVVTRSLSERPLRRRFLHSLAALISAPRVLRGASAKPKHGHKHKKRKKHKKRGQTRDAPVARPDAVCAFSTWGSMAGARRFAQTFRALRSGALTSAAIGLTYNGEGAAFELAIRELDPDGKPGYVLARTTISDVPGTNLGELPARNIPPRTISGVFAAPATVVAGQPYALTLTQTERGTGWEDWIGPFTVQTNQENACSDGMAFEDKLADGAFRSAATFDIAFSTVVSA